MSSIVHPPNIFLQTRTEVSTIVHTYKALTGGRWRSNFLDKYKAQSHWVTDTQNLLGSAVEPKAELYQKKAQLAKYKVA